METRTDQRQAKLEYEGKTRHDTTLKTFPGSHLLSALRKIDAPLSWRGQGEAKRARCGRRGANVMKSNDLRSAVLHKDRPNCPVLEYERRLPT